MATSTPTQESIGTGRLSILRGNETFAPILSDSGTATAVTFSYIPTQTFSPHGSTGHPSTPAPGPSGITDQETTSFASPMGSTGHPSTPAPGPSGAANPRATSFASPMGSTGHPSTPAPGPSGITDQETASFTSPMGSTGHPSTPAPGPSMVTTLSESPTIGQIMALGGIRSSKQLAFQIQAKSDQKLPSAFAVQVLAGDDQVVFETHMTSFHEHGVGAKITVGFDDEAAKEAALHFGLQNYLRVVTKSEQDLGKIQSVIIGKRSN